MLSSRVSDEHNGPAIKLIKHALFLISPRNVPALPLRFTHIIMYYIGCIYTINGSPVWGGLGQRTVARLIICNKYGQVDKSSV